MAIIKTKKKWYSIVSPMFNNAIIGETLGYEPKDLENRKLDINFMSITNDPKNQNTKILFRVNGVKDNNVIVDVMGCGLTLSYVKRLIRKDANKVVDSFNYITKDDVKVIVKPLLITRFKTNKGVLNNLRKTTRSFLTEEIKKYDYNDFIKAVVSNYIQKALRERLKKIYPLISCEFRIIKRI